MRRCLVPLFALLPFAGQAQARPPLAGRTYLARMGNACAETSTGGCWKTYYYRLRFGPDSVTATWIVQAVCSGSGQASTTYTDTTQTQRHAYYILDQPREVVIPSFQFASLSVADDNLVGQRPPAAGGGQIVFGLDTVVARP